MVICSSDGTYNHLIWWSLIAFDMLPLIWLVWVDLSILNFKQMLLDELTQAKLVSWCMTCTADCTVHVTIWLYIRAKFQISERSDWFETNISIYGYKCLYLFPNVSQLASLKAFSYLRKEISIRAWLYVALTGHITARNISRKNKSMRNEPQDMVLAFDMLARKLPCVSRFTRLKLKI